MPAARKANLGRVREHLPVYYLQALLYKGGDHMDVQVIGQLIASLGFPIVACGAMFWMVNKQEERHKEEMDGMRKTIEDNTNVLTSLKDLIQIMINREQNK